MTLYLIHSLRWEENIILKLGRFTSKWFTQNFCVKDKLPLPSKFTSYRKGVNEALFYRWLGYLCCKDPSL